MNLSRWRLLLCLTALFAVAASAWAQQIQRSPHIGYLYPAGGQQGATVAVTVGGQYLGGVTGVLVSGSGVQATVGAYSRPLTPQQFATLREKLQEVRKRLQAEGQNGRLRGARAATEAFTKVAREVGLSEEDLRAFNEFRRRLTDPKRQLNPQIAETVIIHLQLAPDAEAGERELRLITAAGLSNPLRFSVSQWPEYCENEPNDSTADVGVPEPLPAIVNGQILPGDVDRFSFQAHQGDHLVVAACARELVPYLADAVPGWFQATLALYNPQGKEVAYADDDRFRPDPVLHYSIPEDGLYVLEIRDALYRGREDFVYRIALGPLPFVTGIFPLGGRVGAQTTVEVTGWNLPLDRLTLDLRDQEPGVHTVSICQNAPLATRVPFALDTLPESLEAEPNDEQQSAQQIALPLIVNGRVDRPGDRDVFRFDGRAGDQLVAEVQARRLNSPLDSLLELTDAKGRQVAVNDDHEDKGAGLVTHHADSFFCTTLPADGTYFLRLGDVQRHGGAEYAYRLRVSPPRPDFALRVVPSSINAPAGATVPLTVYALRGDAFSDEIALELREAPPGFTLSGGWIPAQQDRVRLTLTVPPVRLQEPIRLHLQGRARIQGHEVCRPAVPAEDMMQAFAYHHLVPAQDWLVAPSGIGRVRTPWRLFQGELVKLPAGGTARVGCLLPLGPLLNQVQVALNDPPDGIAIQEVSPVRGGVVMLLSADADQVRPGLQGNLIVDAFIERTAGPEKGRPQANPHRIPLGTLPAIPFEIVGP